MRILIVDDDPEIVAFFTQATQVRGYLDVEVAQTAEAALSHVIRHPYDVITLDIEMPGASGLEILALLRNLSPHAVIAVISGHIPEETTGHLASCADVLIDKPVALDDFHRLLDGAAAICEAMDEIRLLGRVPLAVH
jgi:DNA-binding response OmpR family regulator